MWKDNFLTFRPNLGRDFIQFLQEGSGLELCSIVWRKALQYLQSRVQKNQTFTNLNPKFSPWPTKNHNKKLSDVVLNYKTTFCRLKRDDFPWSNCPLGAGEGHAALAAPGAALPGPRGHRGGGPERAALVRAGAVQGSAAGRWFFIGTCLVKKRWKHGQNG